MTDSPETNLRNENWRLRREVSALEAEAAALRARAAHLDAAALFLAEKISLEEVVASHMEDRIREREAAEDLDSKADSMIRRSEEALALAKEAASWTAEVIEAVKSMNNSMNLMDNCGQLS